MVSRWRRRTAVEMRSAISAVSLLPCLERVERVEADLLAGGDLIGIGGVPLGDAGVEIPAVEVDALIGFEEFGEEFAGAGEGLAFEVDEADDYVGDLHAGVVDVVLHADFVAGLVAVGTEQALEGVAEDGVAEVADVGGFVGVDAGVLDQAEAGAADVGVLVGGDAADGGGAVEADVEIACAGDLYAGDAFEVGKCGGEFCGQFGGDGAGGFAEALGELEGDRKGEFAQGDVGRLLDDQVREGDVVFCEEDGLDAGQERLLDCAIHALGFHRFGRCVQFTQCLSCRTGPLRAGDHFVVCSLFSLARSCATRELSTLPGVDFRYGRSGWGVVRSSRREACGCGCGCGG